jgi:uncharacterized repeat protein (TIGR01451 family)
LRWLHQNAVGLDVAIDDISEQVAALAIQGPTSGRLLDAVADAGSADLSLTKTVDDPTPTVGDTVAFTLTLSNAGPDAATGVTVTDLLPAGLSFVSATPSQGTYAEATGIWSVGTVTSTTAPTLVIRARVATTGTLANYAQVSAADQADRLDARRQQPLEDGTTGRPCIRSPDHRPVADEQGVGHLAGSVSISLHGDRERHGWCQRDQVVVSDLLVAPLWSQRVPAKAPTT